VNLIGSFNFCRLVAEKIRDQPDLGGEEKGIIVNVSSAAGTDAASGMVAYASAKGGVDGMTLPMARDLAYFGIRVCTIAPSFFETPLNQATPQAIKEKLLADTVIRRFGRLQEFVNAVKFLIENEYMTGGVLRVDGGYRSSRL
jgi:NAD(P)-dependent dehydrogenase (short-subunit alcohol dehydrogenase family)